LKKLKVTGENGWVRKLIHAILMTPSKRYFREFLGRNCQVKDE